MSKARTHNIGIANSWAGYWSNSAKGILLCCGSELENIPTNNQSENRSDEIIPATDTDTITQNQEIENMEVHHHPNLHHRRKISKNIFWNSS